jgi:hypothetical protein
MMYGPGEMPDSTEEHWVVWIDRRTGEVGSTWHISVDDAWDYANRINDRRDVHRAYVASKL